MTGIKEPLALAADVIGGLTSAVLATEVSALAVLKAEMEGLSVLFGGESAPKTEEQLRAEDAAEEASFDNMPV